MKRIHKNYATDAQSIHRKGGHAIIAGENYGQGSSREHAALGPRYLGLHLVIAKSFARIHWQNLVNFGILPLVFTNPKDYDLINRNDVIVLKDIIRSIKKGNELSATLENKKDAFVLRHDLSLRQVDILIAGRLINLVILKRNP